MDPRTANLARLLVQYSISVQKDEVVLLSGPPAATPLLQCLHEECLKSGAHPIVEIDPPWVQESLLAHGKKKQLAFLPEWKSHQAEGINALVRVLADTNTRRFSSADPRRQRELLESQKPVRELLRRRMDQGSLRWSVTLFPTEAYAQDSDLSLAEFEHFVYSACKVNGGDPVRAWNQVRRRQDRIIDFLSDRKRVRIVSEDTDLAFSVAGRTWVNCAGECNMPDGEVFTGPEEESAEGVIRFTFPACHQGREVENVKLTFRGGKAVKSTASKNEVFLNEMLDMDPGARRLGEFSFATNTAIQRFTRNILFDEKIGGTVHLALGSSYSQSGGKNRSALHWDMICDLRTAGKVYLDDKLFLADGRFLKKF